jgi:hypothetical protein
VAALLAAKATAWAVAAAATMNAGSTFHKWVQQKPLQLALVALAKLQTVRVMWAATQPLAL